MPDSRRDLRLGAVAIAIAIAAAACGSSPVALGTSPEILWWTDNEAGGFDDWGRGGPELGGTSIANGGQIDLATTYARSGTHALHATVTSPGSGSGSSGVAMRTGILPEEAYYSAWYYVPEPMTSGQYWLFFKIRSRKVAADPATAVHLWDLDFSSRPDGSMGVFLYHHDTGNRTPLATKTAPLRRWFQVEVFLRAASDATGRLKIWFDGTLIYDLTEKTTESAYVEWSVGGIAEVIAPTGIGIYVDDAAISTERLGPSYPIFWRAP